MVCCRLFNEGFYLHSRITVQIFNSEAPVILFNLLGWGELTFTTFTSSVQFLSKCETEIKSHKTSSHFPLSISFLKFLFITICLTKHQNIRSHAGGLRVHLGGDDGDGDDGEVRRVV